MNSVCRKRRRILPPAAVPVQSILHIVPLSGDSMAVALACIAIVHSRRLLGFNRATGTSLSGQTFDCGARQTCAVSRPTIHTPLGAENRTTALVPEDARLIVVGMMDRVMRAVLLLALSRNLDKSGRSHELLTAAEAWTIVAFTLLIEMVSHKKQESASCMTV
jgi:hypothetical protein